MTPPFAPATEAGLVGAFVVTHYVPVKMISFKQVAEFGGGLQKTAPLVNGYAHISFIQS